MSKSSEAALKRSRDWYYANHEANKENRKLRAREYRRNFPDRRMVHAAKDRARVLGVPFNLVPGDVEIPDTCPILNLPMVAGTRHAPSLDRIVPELGYVKGNVQVISRKANVMKNDATMEELKRFYEWLKKIFQH